MDKNYFTDYFSLPSQNSPIIVTADHVNCDIGHHYILAVRNNALIDFVDISIFRNLPLRLQGSSP